MKTTNTFGVHFIIRMNKSKNGQAPLYARVVVDNQRVEISLRKSIKITDWNSERGMLRGSRDEAKSLNHFLEEVKVRMMECYRELQIQKHLITAETIKNKFLGSDQKDHTLCKLMESHNTNMKHSLTWGTLKNYFTTQNILACF